MSILKASKKYRIPYGTLYNKCNGLHQKSIGGQLRLSSDTESKIVDTINCMANWKIPVDSMNIRLLVKEYLDSQGINDRRFKNNCPGVEWMKSFMKRHQLTARLCDNVKPSRAEIDDTVVNKYFDELERTLVDVTPDNLFNYDETNVSDDPGEKTIICWRGLKRVERKMQHSKSCVTLMYCGNASGEYLPPMVVYKSKHCYTEWMRGGPCGTIYDSTVSGWFDGRCFGRWFTEVF